MQSPDQASAELAVSHSVPVPLRLPRQIGIEAVIFPRHSRVCGLRLQGTVGTTCELHRPRGTPEVPNRKTAIVVV